MQAAKKTGKAATLVALTLIMAHLSIRIKDYSKETSPEKGLGGRGAKGDVFMD